MKRSTPMRRTAFLRTPVAASSTPVERKEKVRQCELNPAPSRCKQCREKFTAEERARALKLHPACEAGYAETFSVKLAAQRAKAERKADRATKEADKSIPKLIAAADRAFALYVRTRDRLNGETCISSGKPLDWSGNKTDAGHYRSRGAASHLRYHPDNCHAQTKHENRHRAGNAVDYRVRLIVRIGLARVEALEADNTPHKWTKDELRAIAADFRRQARELLKARDA